MSFKSRFKFAFFVLSSIIIAFILGYLHEGYHSNTWMLTFKDWLKLVLFSFCIFTVQAVFAKVFFSKYHGIRKIAISLFGGISIGFVLIFMF